MSDPGPYQPYEPYRPSTPPPVSLPYGYPGSPYGPPQNTSVNGLAIASLVLGIVWMCGVGSILAVVLGHVARGQIRRERSQGDGMAIVGLVLGYLGIAVIVGYIALISLAAIAGGRGY